MGAAVVMGVDAPPIFEFGEHGLDLVALAVECQVVENLGFPVLFCGDTGRDPALCKGIAQPVGVTSQVGLQRLCRGHRSQQGRGSGVVGDLAVPSRMIK